jgi:hypothetical protein
VSLPPYKDGENPEELLGLGVDSAGPSGSARRPPAETASGLYEREIAAEDICELQSLLTVRPLALAAPPVEYRSLAASAWTPALDKNQLRSVELSLATPRNLKLRIAALPKHVKTHALKLTQLHCKVRHSLELALRQPVRRSRISAARLSPALHAQILAGLAKQLGGALRELELDSVFAHVPPELKEGLRLSGDGSSLGILVPKGFNPARASSGHYLVLLHPRGGSGETRRVLLRL